MYIKVIASQSWDIFLKHTVDWRRRNVSYRSEMFASQRQQFKKQISVQKIPRRRESVPCEFLYAPSVWAIAMGHGAP